jgi:hypothetical protein
MEHLCRLSARLRRAAGPRGCLLMDRSEAIDRPVLALPQGSFVFCRHAGRRGPPAAGLPSDILLDGERRPEVVAPPGGYPSRNPHPGGPPSEGDFDIEDTLLVADWAPEKLWKTVQGSTPAALPRTGREGPGRTAAGPSERSRSVPLIAALMPKIGMRGV